MFDMTRLGKPASSHPEMVFFGASILGRKSMEKKHALAESKWVSVTKLVMGERCVKKHTGCKKKVENKRGGKPNRHFLKGEGKIVCIKYGGSVNG